MLHNIIIGISLVGFTASTCCVLLGSGNEKRTDILAVSVFGTMLIFGGAI